MPAIKPPGDMPPPRKGDVVFKGNPQNWQTTARLDGIDDRRPHVPYLIYAEGYSRAAKILVQHVLDTGEANSLVYPVVFLYRHHLELGLKRILSHSSKLLRRELTEGEKKNLEAHRLDRLWQDVKPLCSLIFEALAWEAPVVADVEGVDDYIRQLTDLDPRAESFRYPNSKKGGPSLPKDLKWIDIRHFAEMMERLTYYIDGIDAGISEFQGYCDEMEAEFAYETGWLDG